jgi:hypothetical protein
VDEDERAAVEFENDLRTAEGRVSRDPNNWPESDCGCPDDCCIVASVATGSPFSAEVHALRRFRDRTLRRTAVGMRFFDVLHREYYGFSVAVSRILATSPAAREQVADWLVRPLIRALELAQHYIRQPDAATRLGELVAGDQVVMSGLLPSLIWQEARRLLDLAAPGSPLAADLPPLDPAVAGIFLILQDKLPHCPHVRWAIVDPLRIYAGAQHWSRQGESASAVGQRLRRDFDEWASSIPLEYLREQVTAADWSRDLPELAVTLFTSVEARRRFGERLTAAIPQPIDEKLKETLRSEGYIL